MNIKINLSLLLTCVLLLSCSSGSSSHKRPKWIDNAASIYLPQDYLTAVGQASTRERASKNAIANLAEIFTVNVRVQSNTLTEATKKQSVLGVSSESSTTLQRHIQTETDQVISGVVIKESWLSPNGEYYALALLNKRTAALSLTESIMDLDDATADFIDYSVNSAPNAIAALNALRAARDQQLRRALANLKLKQVSASGIPNDISSGKIEHLIAQKLAAMQVSVLGDSARHKKTIQSGLAKLGVAVVENSDLQIHADIDITEPTLINNWYWLRGSYQLSVSQGAQVISRKRWPVKISAKQQELLIPRLQDNINSKISGYLVELISDSPTL